VARGTVFQPFLDQSMQRPGRGRGLLVSLALHGLGALLIWLAWGQVESGAPPHAALVQQVEVSVRPRIADRAVGPVALEPGGPAAERPKRAVSSNAPRRTRAAVVAIAPAPEPPVTAEGPAEDAGDQPDRGDDPGGPQAGGLGAVEGSAVDGGQGGGRPGRRRPVELFGRVVGGGRGAVMGPRGLPYAPLKESTELRTYDFFPPLPAAQWASDRPYLVVLDVCVSGEGQVSDVALVKPASRIFDPVVLEAVRTWRYRPRLVDGQAQSFCHVVAIKYERL
jgi:TonB family protein